MFTDIEQRIEGGTQALANAIAKELESKSKNIVSFDSPVISINCNKGSNFEVTYVNEFKTQTISCANIVVTVPFNTLFRILFNPQLPDNIIKQSIRGHAASGTRKTWYNSDDSLDNHKNWQTEESVHTILFNARYPLKNRHCTITLSHPDNHPQLQNETNTPTSPLSLFPSYSQASCHDWAADMWYRGTWMVPRVNQYDAVENIRILQLRGGNGSVLFASGDFSLVWPGWMEGAIYAGFEAAKKIKEIGVKKSKL